MIRFGAGSFAEIPGLANKYGNKALVVTGARSFADSGGRAEFERMLAEQGIESLFEVGSGEPTPELVDAIAARYRNKSIGVVIAIGGGSSIDTGKAVSAMLTVDAPVFDFLEGVGTGKNHPGTKVPFIAVPTTAGTGSEATKNAVLSRTGRDGFKRSIRHDNFVPDIAVIDPALALSCPPAVTAASGLDALTQLVEPYVSTAASPLTDALALSGLKAAAGSLIPVATDNGGDIVHRSNMAYAALMSGIALANAGLGVVHGFASSIGARIDIPHGVVCGTLLAASTRVTVEKLRKMGYAGLPALDRYAAIGAILAPSSMKYTKHDHINRLLNVLEIWTETLDMPRLGVYGFTSGMIKTVAAETSPKNNPGNLTSDDIVRILKMRL
jgi:alcohol dehydrogenase class IV